MNSVNLRYVRDIVAKAPVRPNGATQAGKDELLDILDRHLRGETTRPVFRAELAISTADATVRDGVRVGLYSRRLVQLFLDWRVAHEGGGHPEKTRDVRAGGDDFFRWYIRERERCFEVSGLVRKMIELHDYPRARALVQLIEELGKAYRELEFAWWPVDHVEPGRRYEHETLPEWLEHEKARLDTRLIRLEGGEQDEIPF